MIEFQKKKFSSSRFYHGWSICLNSWDQKIKNLIQIIPTIIHFIVHRMRDVLRFYFSPALSHVRIIMVRPPSKSFNWELKSQTTNRHSSIVAQNEKCIFRARALDVLTCFPIHFKEVGKKYYMVTFNLSRSLYNIITLAGMCYHHGFLFVCGRMIEYFRKEICTFLMVFHRHDWHQVKYVKS